MSKEQLIKELLSSHEKIVLQAFSTNGATSAKTIPDSVHQYTNMFLTNLKSILKDLQ